MGADRGYFVRLGTEHHGVMPGVPVRGAAGSDHSARPRRHRRPPIVRPIVSVLLALAIGWFVWAQVDQNSSANRDIQHAIQSARGAVQKASTDPDLKRAAVYFDDQFARTGSYPNLTDDQQHDNPETDFGVGVTVKWCNYQAVVLQSLTGSGSLSRL